MLFHTRFCKKARMMSPLQSVSLGLTGEKSALGQAQLALRPLTRLERYQRAARRVALSWAATGLFMGIPKASFILVPLFFVLGLLWGFFGLKEGVVFTASTLPCPKCQTPIEVKEGVTGWPLRLFCRQCESSLDGKPA